MPPLISVIYTRAVYEASVKKNSIAATAGQLNSALFKFRQLGYALCEMRPR
jgi:hypothetical protein